MNLPVAFQHYGTPLSEDKADSSRVYKTFYVPWSLSNRLGWLWSLAPVHSYVANLSHFLAWKALMCGYESLRGGPIYEHATLKYEAVTYQ